MSAAIRSTPSLSIPPSQNTAPVLEFSCLYTHDVRRKQKRWQDGFLRYHTFNKRVMVFDMPRNYLGDTHWTQGADLQEGDEMTLEKTGIVVQVAEEVGRTETDLSELLQRKDKPSPARKAYTPAPPLPQKLTPRAPTNATPIQSKHKSLTSLLGPSRGLVGRAALPVKSPFDARNGVPDAPEWESGQQSKRQKTEAWNVVRTTKTIGQATAGVRAQARSRPGTATKATKKPADAGQHRLNVTEVIDLSSDHEQASEGDSSHYTAHNLPTSSPPRLHDKSAQAGTSNGKGQSHAVECHPMQTAVPDSSLEVVESPSVRQLQRKQISTRIQEPLTSRAHGHTPPKSVPGQPEHEVNSPRPPPTRSSKATSVHAEDISDGQVPTTGTDSQKQGRALKLAGNAPRKMLIFQNQASKSLSQKKSRLSEKEVTSGLDRRVDNRKSELTRQVTSPQEHDKADEHQEALPSIHRQRMQERLDRIEKRKSGTNIPNGDQVVSGSTVAQRPDGSDERLSAAAQSHTTKAGTSTIERGGANPTVSKERGTRTSSSSFLHPGAREVTPASKDQANAPSRPPSKPPSLSPPRGVTEPLKTMLPPPRPCATKNKTKQPPVYNKRPQGAATVMLSREFKAPSAQPVTVPGLSEQATSMADKDLDLGPWSKEAFDLMDWRPPNRDSEGKKIVPIAQAGGG